LRRQWQGASRRLLRQDFRATAAGDAGGALGAALAVSHAENPLSDRKGATPKLDSMQGAYLGPAYEQSDIERRLLACGAIFSVADDASLIEQTAGGTRERASGWLASGRMEFGPRALGNRSILGDPRSQACRKR